MDYGSLETQHSVRVKGGSKLITENEMSQKMYVIIKGRARVYKTYLGQRITLAVLGDGEIFGEMSFIDAQPRSASVDALTDMDVIIIDGAKGSEQLKNLPPWVWVIFKTVFHRFRELDREIVSLRSALGYRKKGLRDDVVASTVYLEMVRFLKTFELVHRSRKQDGRSLKALDVLEEIDGVLGNKAIGLKNFWKLLLEYDFIDPNGLRDSGEVHFVEDRVKGFESYLKKAVEEENYLMLSHGALSILRRIVASLKPKDGKAIGDDIKVHCDEIKVRTIPNHEQALSELQRVQVIPFVDNVFQVEPDSLHKIFIYHSILKSFDHSAIYVD